MCQNHLLDREIAEDFSGRLLDLLNHGALSLMISVGHRTGLFDAMAEHPPGTFEELAEASGQNERYVREWLGAMVTGRIVEHDAETGHYSLPPEHAAFLTRKASPDNMAAIAQYIPLLGSVEDLIVDCFENGGGVPYARYGRFHEIMAEESAQTIVSVLFDSILPLVPGLPQALDGGIDVLDVGCGSGRALIQLARAYPTSRFVGIDISEEATGRAREEATSLGLQNIEFRVQDATQFQGSFDLITAFDAIHDQARPDLVLARIQGALREGGVFLMQDIRGSSHVHKNLDHPAAPFLYTISCLHCMTVSLAQGGAGLGAMWGEELAQEMLEQAGFEDVRVDRLPHDFQNNYYVARKAG